MLETLARGSGRTRCGSALTCRALIINGLPGFVTVEADGLLQTTALEIVDGKIAGVYMMRNPDKLRHLDGGEQL